MGNERPGLTYRDPAEDAEAVACHPHDFWGMYSVGALTGWCIRGILPPGLAGTSLAIFLLSIVAVTATIVYLYPKCFRRMRMAHAQLVAFVLGLCAGVPGLLLLRFG